MTAARPGSGAMFDGIAPRYDLLNRIASLGLDNSWRRRAVRALALPDAAVVLDLATGTGDVALQIAESYPAARIIGVDPSEGMLAIARDKIARAGLAERIELRLGDACELPFARASLDGVIIAFGIRNVPDRAGALAEMARVTRPSGRVVVLELSEPEPGFVGSVARLHVHSVVPRLGAWLSRAPEYRYLERSIAAFPAPPEFAALLERAGLALLDVERLGFGACRLFVAQAGER
jgi:demethylmenaquinone methyltransferase/2-methoxy-6-polyprenyl-1,4-benzoquinol methylase